MDKEQLARLDRRIALTKRLQVSIPLDQRSWVPGRVVGINDRSARPGAKLKEPNPDRSACDYCHWRVLPTVATVRDNQLFVPGDERAFDAGLRWLEQHSLSGETFRGLLEELQSENEAMGESQVAVFGNIVPLRTVGQCNVLGSFVVAPAAKFHDADHAVMPVAVLAQQVMLWQAFCRYARVRGMVPCIGINSGFGSGASVFHPHSQIMLLADVPSFRSFAAVGPCPVCGVLQFDSRLEIPVSGPRSALGLAAHPAPEGNWSLIVGPRTHEANFEEADPFEVAGLIQAGLEGITLAASGERPAYNVYLRSGAVPHWHIEIVARTGFAGFAELVTKEIVVATAPERVRDDIVRCLADGRHI